MVSGLTNGTTYWFAVAAYDNAGNTSAKKHTTKRHPIAPPPPDTTPPDTPTGLIVSGWWENLVISTCPGIPLPHPT